MGMKPEIFVEWGFGCRYRRKDCKFAIIPILNKCKLKRFKMREFEEYVKWGKEMNFFRMKSLQHIELGMHSLI